MSEQEYKGLHFKPDTVNPQGKQKVYFCCHEADFSAFFEPIMEEIRAIQPNVTFWYYDPTEGIPSGEAFLADLSQMQLFVIPVTYRFIYQDTPARTVEFQYAIDHNIPVLPLMQEPGLEEEFNRVCGDLQLLDKYASEIDPTALPYEEKLKKYLQSVLISDKLEKKIRDAFDAYVFLSYRKKDRKNAQEIMNLIHDNENCRDVAIWYDEFLTPGERFNNAIQEVLNKSNLYVFALVVTPRLLEKDNAGKYNYVVEIEYPAAKKSNKTIAPIQAKETDLNELNRALKEQGVSGIDSLLSTEYVKDHFHDLFHEVTLGNNRNDPKHEFYMGLAYLNGIDVEVNHERALELISAAAEANLPEAYEKLVSMYQNGEGVTRNYHTAIEWQQKYVSYLKEIADETPSKGTLTNYCNSLLSLGEYQETVGDNTGAKQSYLDSLDHAKKLVEETETTDSLSLLAHNYQHLASINHSEGEISDAIDRFRQAIKIIEDVAKETKTELSLFKVAMNYELMGKTVMEDNLGKSRKWLEAALRIYKKLMTEIGKEQYYLRWATCLSIIGSSWLVESGPESKARLCFSKAFDIAEKLAEETGNESGFSIMAKCLGYMGNMCMEKGLFDEAMNSFEAALRIYKMLFEKTKKMSYHMSMAASYRNLGTVSWITGDLSTARDMVQQSLEITEQYLKETGTVQSLSGASMCYERLGAISIEENKYSEAKNWIHMAVDAVSRLSRITELWFAPQMTLAVCFGYLGRICIEENNYSEAKKWLNKALSLDMSLLEKSRSVEQHMMWIIDTLEKISKK